MSTIRVGTSGWVYQHWKGIFYPAGLAQGRWFAHYSQHFDTVEINNTFYRLPAGSAFDAWREQAPPGFLYSVKVNRYITHVKRLKECAEPLDRFLDRVRRLGPFLGPLLYQLPPRWHANLERLAEFAALLPADLTHVFEFRDPTWFVPEVFDLLRARGLAFCVYNFASHQSPIEVTADPAYVRFHGSGAPFGGPYDDGALAEWARRIREWQRAGNGVYVYFNNDGYGAALRNAQTLREMVSQNSTETG